MGNSLGHGDSSNSPRLCDTNPTDTAIRTEGKGEMDGGKEGEGRERERGEEREGERGRATPYTHSSHAHKNIVSTSYMCTRTSSISSLHTQKCTHGQSRNRTVYKLAYEDTLPPLLG